MLVINILVSCGSGYRYVMLITDKIVFTSPNFPNNYINNYKCSWTFQAPPGYIVNIAFTDFNTEAGFDVVSFYSGNNTVGNPTVS